MTIETMELLKGGLPVFLRTEVHPTCNFLKEQNIFFTSMDTFYEKKDSFEEVYADIVRFLLEESKMYGEIIYGVPGHPMVGETTVKKLLEYCCNQGEYEMIVYPCTSFIDASIPRLGIDPSEGLLILDALTLQPEDLDLSKHNVIMHVYDQLLASELKLKLGRVIPDNYIITVLTETGATEENYLSIPLYQLDRVKVNHLTSVYISPIPFEEKEKFQMEDLKKIVEILRGEKGCPWDREQTHESLLRHLLEESYEVLDAVERKDPKDLSDELGDLILQVYLHSQIADENGDFDIFDVFTKVCKKMIRRHPHVFKDLKLSTSCEVEDNWDKIKVREKGKPTLVTSLKGIPKGMATLMRAEKIQKVAAKYGFDWETIEGPLSKIKEEINELEEVYNSDDSVKIMEEIGDLFFAIVNLSRFLKISPEMALHYTNQKFLRRISYMEEEIESQRGSFSDKSLQELDFLWEKSKKAVKNE
jgi:tetrapyrrole methylase family protein/MazG family protein